MTITFKYTHSPVHTRGSARLLVPNNNNNNDDDDDDTSEDIHTSNERSRKPLIICFHGSGETCSPSWDALATKLVTELRCRVLLYDRGPGNQQPADVAAQVWEYVTRTSDQKKTEVEMQHQNPRDECGVTHKNRKHHDLDGPYLLIAHSYGGAFARAFVQHESIISRRPWPWQREEESGGDCQIFGLVLVETGQEGGLDAALDERQIREVVMGTRPVCVIRGNSLLHKWKGLEEKARAVGGVDGDDMATTQTMRQMLVAEREVLEHIDAEDERLKRRQLGLSRTSRLVHLRDCGHHIVRDRPGDIVDAVWWVLESADRVEDDEGGMNAWKGTLEKLRRFGLWRW
ncbi:Alpha/Beta hydrolase protein [Xylaria arbuscula]|nr:Alpha/Beta hydrolase protein [Xylaria arbuscula]